MAGPHTVWTTQPAGLSGIADAISKLSYTEMMELATAIDDNLPTCSDSNKIATVLLKVAAMFKPKPSTEPTPR